MTVAQFIAAVETECVLALNVTMPPGKYIPPER